LFANGGLLWSRADATAKEDCTMGSAGKSDRSKTDEPSILPTDSWFKVRGPETVFFTPPEGAERGSSERCIGSWYVEEGAGFAAFKCGIPFFGRILPDGIISPMLIVFNLGFLFLFLLFPVGW
jgi:hypothetical protein